MVKKKEEHSIVKVDLKYKRYLIWLWGAIGGWSPDMDSLGGPFANIINGGTEPWSFSLFYKYHRDFSHSIGFLIVTIIGILVLFNTLKKGDQNTKEPNNNTRNQRFITYGFVAMIAGFLIYSRGTRYFAFFFIIGTMAFLIWAFHRGGVPLYGLAFFAGALLHHVCDFIQCEWNPLAPWDPTVEIGLGLYCGYQNILLYYPIEITPHIIVFIMLVYRLVKFTMNKPERKEKINIDALFDKLDEDMSGLHDD
jgi:hypothetical protein